MVAAHWASLEPIPIGKPLLSSAENRVLSKLDQSLKMVAMVGEEAAGCCCWFITTIIIIIIIIIIDHDDDIGLECTCAVWAEPGGAACMDHHPH